MEGRREIEAYPPTNVAVLLRVKRGPFQRHGLAVIRNERSDTFSLPVEAQRTGETWQAAAVRATLSQARIPISPESLKVINVVTSAGAVNFLLCQSERIRSDEAIKAGAQEVVVVTKPVEMTTPLLTTAVKAFFEKRYRSDWMDWIVELAP